MYVLPDFNKSAYFINVHKTWNRVEEKEVFADLK